MPKEMTHWALAKRVYRRLPGDSRLRKLIGQNWHAYLLGAVLPDSPFYLVSGPGSRDAFLAGEAIHDPPASSYRPVERVLNHFFPDCPDAILAMLLGAITHLDADAAFHPFVHFFSGIEGGGATGRRRALARHRTLETHLDLYFVENHGPPKIRKTARLLKRAGGFSGPLMETISVFFSEDRRLPEAVIRRALRMNAVIQGLFVAPWSRRVSRVLDQWPALDIDPWTRSFYPVRPPERGTIFRGVYKFQHPATGEARSRTIEEMANDAVTGAAKAISEIDACAESSKKMISALNGIEGPNLYTGRVGLRKAAMRHFDTRRDVFDIIFNSVKG